MSAAFWFPNVRLPDGTWECGTEDAAILFKPGGGVRIRRGSKSLKPEWRSLAGRRGALNEKNGPCAGLDPVVFELMTAGAVELSNTVGP